MISGMTYDAETNDMYLKINKNDVKYSLVVNIKKQQSLPQIAPVVFFDEQLTYELIGEKDLLNYYELTKLGNKYWGHQINLLTLSKYTSAGTNPSTPTKVQNVNKASRCLLM